MGLPQGLAGHLPNDSLLRIDGTTPALLHQKKEGLSIGRIVGTLD
jgi:hypothetical protein